jgi:hypothetical protein
LSSGWALLGHVDGALLAAAAGLAALMSDMNHLHCKSVCTAAFCQHTVNNLQCLLLDTLRSEIKDSTGSEKHPKAIKL